MGRFNKGIFLGGILGASLVWMSATKKGRQVREELFDHAAVVYAQVKDKLLASDAWKNMSQSEYAATVKEIIDKYAVKTGLAKEMKAIVERMVRSQWKNMRKKMASDSKNPS